MRLRFLFPRFYRIFKPYFISFSLCCFIGFPLLKLVDDQVGQVKTASANAIDEFFSNNTIDCGSVVNEASWKPSTGTKFERAKLLERISDPDGNLDCDAMKSVFQMKQEAMSEEEVQFPLAYGLHVYKDLVSTLLTLSAFYHPQNSYCIGLDASGPPIYKKQVHQIGQCLPNITILARKTQWMVQKDTHDLCAQLLLSLDQFQSSMDVLPSKFTTVNDIVSFKYIAGSDLPMKTNLEMVRIFKALNGSLNIEITPRSIRNGGLVPMHKASLSALISRNAANFVAHNSDALKSMNDLETKLKVKGCADEFIWGTLFGNVKRIKAPGAFDMYKMRKAWRLDKSRPKLSNRTRDEVKERFAPDRYYVSRYQVWQSSRRKCHGKFVRSSCVFAASDLAILMHRPELVAHKFSLDVDPAAFHCMRSLVMERAAHPSQSTFAARAYNDIAQVQVFGGADPESVRFN